MKFCPRLHFTESERVEKIENLMFNFINIATEIYTFDFFCC